MPGLNGRRVAVVAGVRTPFTKAGTLLKEARAVDLARYAGRSARPARRFATFERSILRNCRRASCCIARISMVAK